jgi:multisubunit Na+/H+ antiporter MnhE subunit
MRRILIAGGGTVFAGAFYLVLIDTRDLPELYALVVVALISGIVFAVARDHESTEASVSAGWLLRAWRPVVRVPLDVALVSRQLVAQLISPRASRGELRAVPFRAGEDAHGLGRTALTESLGSFTPNTIVIGVDAERDLLLVHQLRRHGERDELDVLGLG